MVFLATSSHPCPSSLYLLMTYYFIIYIQVEWFKQQKIKRYQPFSVKFDDPRFKDQWYIVSLSSFTFQLISILLAVPPPPPPHKKNAWNNLLPCFSPFTSFVGRCSRFVLKCGSPRETSHSELWAWLVKRCGGEKRVGLVLLFVVAFLFNTPLLKPVENSQKRACPEASKPAFDECRTPDNSEFSD